MSKSKVLASIDDKANEPDSSGGPESPAEGANPPAVIPPLFDRLLAIKPGCRDADIEALVASEILSKLEASGLAKKHNILFLHDTTSIAQSDANRIYSAIKGCDSQRPLLLILSSPGGDVAAAYLIAKVCRAHTASAFEVAVPRQAKSAATLICCGADKIHMGSLSELGPIDPQFSGIPALAYKHSIEHIAQLVTDYPAASSMFSEYLGKTLPVQALGYFERVAESASQYAIRLLNSRTLPTKDEKRNAEIAKRLVHLYKDHGFVIDSAEAAEIFGASVVMTETQEYEVARDIFESLDTIAWYCRTRLNKRLSLVGNTDGCLVLDVPTGGAA